jgi:phage virion morphogenesis protein
MRFDMQFQDDDGRYFSALQARAQNTEPLMQAFANYGEQQTRQTFATETAPDGTKWKDSRRKLEKGGKTLTKEGHLGDSVGSNYANDRAEFGLGMMYASIHQFGGTITPKKAGGFLAFATPSGDFAVVRSVTIPKRQMLPQTLEELGVDELVSLTQAYLLSETP